MSSTGPWKSAIDRIPDHADCDAPNEYHRCIVHRDFRYRQCSRHAKEHQFKQDPYQCQPIRRRAGHLTCVPAGCQDFPTAIRDADGNWHGVCDSKGDDSDRSKRSKRASISKVDQSEEHFEHGDETQGWKRPLPNRLRPQAGIWNGIVARHGPGTPGGCSCNTN